MGWDIRGAQGAEHTVLSSPESLLGPNITFLSDFLSKVAINCVREIKLFSIKYPPAITQIVEMSMSMLEEINPCRAWRLLLLLPPTKWKIFKCYSSSHLNFPLSFTIRIKT